MNLNSQKLADVNSPYEGNSIDEVKRNILYARAACRWCFLNGYIPFASHLLYTQPGVLNNDEKWLGVKSGKELIRASAQVSLFFMDLHESTGMRFSRRDAENEARDIIDILLLPRGAPRSTLLELNCSLRSADLIGDTTVSAW